MERVNKIMTHPLFVSNQKRIEELECDRVFCRHGLNHSLDVARILYIKVLEQGLDIKKDVIYGVALLHDIGRGMEYEDGVAHHEAGAVLAKDILSDCDYTKEEQDCMMQAIKEHKEKSEQDILCKLLFEADKLSRGCYDCKAITECYWPEERKNHIVTY